MGLEVITLLDMTDGLLGFILSYKMRWSQVKTK